MTRKRKTEARKKRKLKELDKQKQLRKTKLEKVTGGVALGGESHGGEDMSLFSSERR